MSGRWPRLAALGAVGVLAFAAALSVGGHLHADRPDATSVESDLSAPRVASGTTPTRVKPTAAKHGRTAPLVPAATLVALTALLLYGFSIAGASAVRGRVVGAGHRSRSPRAPPALV